MNSRNSPVRTEVCTLASRGPTLLANNYIESGPSNLHVSPGIPVKFEPSPFIAVIFQIRPPMKSRVVNYERLEINFGNSSPRLQPRRTISIFGSPIFNERLSRRIRRRTEILFNPLNARDALWRQRHLYNLDKLPADRTGNKSSPTIRLIRTAAESRGKT